MAEKNKMASQESIVCSTTAASNTDSVATVTAPAVGQTIYVTGIIVSASATITTGNGVTAALTGTVGGTFSMRIPASSIAPVALLFGVHPLRITPQTNAVLTLPALGTNVVGTATLLYYIGAS